MHIENVDDARKAANSLILKVVDIQAADNKKLRKQIESLEKEILVKDELITSLRKSIENMRKDEKILYMQRQVI